MDAEYFTQEIYKVAKRIGNMKLFNHVFPFNKIELSDLCLYDNQGDTLLHAQRLIAGVALQELLQRRLVFTTVQLYDFEVSLQRETPDAPLNLQFILDRFKKEGTSAIDLHSQINTILARRGTLRYDVHSEAPRGAGLFDPNHVAVSDFLATVSLKSLERDSININIRKISFEEKSGFSLRKFGAKLIGNRENVVLSRQQLEIPGCRVVHSLDEAVALFPADEELFVIGGAEIYAEALPRAAKFYLTRVCHAYEGDTRFPAWDVRKWRLVASEAFERGVAYPYPFVFETYERR